MLLAIETSTSRSSIALADGDGTVLAAAELGRDRRHGEFVTPAIAELLHHLGASIDDVRVVAAGLGPGLYTGLRVGLVTAATIVATRGLQGVGVLGTGGISHALRHSDRDVVVALDARRRELYLARHDRDDEHGGLRAHPASIEVLTPVAAADALRDRGGRVLLAGDGVDALLPHLDDDPVGLDVALVGADHQHPTAAALVPLALQALDDGRGGGAEVFRPLYLRDADARIGWDERGRLRGGAAAVAG